MKSDGDPGEMQANENYVLSQNEYLQSLKEWRYGLC